MGNKQIKKSIDSYLAREMTEILEVKVIPNAPKNERIRWEGNRLVLKIQGISIETIRKIMP